MLFDISHYIVMLLSDMMYPSDESMSSDLSIELSLQEEFQPFYHSLSIQEDEEEQDNEEEELPSFLQQDNKSKWSKLLVVLGNLVFLSMID